MKKTIWKYQLETIDNQSIEIPINAKILTVQMQENIPCLWALVDPSAGKEIRHVEIFGTGHPISYDHPGERNYIGSYQLISLDGECLVFHVFEKLL